MVHLADLELRKIHLAAGFPSLHAYCEQELQLSDYEAYNRIEAARAGRAYPRIFNMLAEGSLTLTTVQLLARKLTPKNCERLLTAATGLTKAQVQELLAKYFPKADVPSSIRKLPAPPAGRDSATMPHVADCTAPATAPPAPSMPAAKAAVSRSSPRAAVNPLAPDRYKITFTADADTCELLALATDMLSHTVPNGDTAKVVKRALETLVAELARNRYQDDLETDAIRRRLAEEPVTRSGTSDRPRPARPGGESYDCGLKYSTIPAPAAAITNPT